MPKCEECAHFFVITEDAGEDGPGKGDCVSEKADKKGKMWTAIEVVATADACDQFEKR